VGAAVGQCHLVPANPGYLGGKLGGKATFSPAACSSFANTPDGGDVVGFGGPGERLEVMDGRRPSFVQSRWSSRSPLRLKAAHRVPG